MERRKENFQWDPKWSFFSSLNQIPLLPVTTHQVWCYCGASHLHTRVSIQLCLPLQEPLGFVWALGFSTLRAEPNEVTSCFGLWVKCWEIALPWEGHRKFDGDHSLRNETCRGPGLRPSWCFFRLFFGHITTCSLVWSVSCRIFLQCVQWKNYIYIHSD